MDQNNQLQAEQPVYKIGKTVYQTFEEYEIALKAKRAKRNYIWDKITTGILILLMASPVLILGYIFLWFLLK